MNRAMKILSAFLTCFCLAAVPTRAETVRAMIAGIHRVSLAEPEGTNIPLSYFSSALIRLEGDTRFFNGIQLELNAPQGFLAHRGSLAAILYGELDSVPGIGEADLQCRRLGFDPLPAKLQAIYQIPLRRGHGLRTSPYATVLTDVVDSGAFPLLFRLMPVIKGISEDLERMVFSLNVRPILTNEGAARISFEYPPNLPDRPLTVLLNGAEIDNPGQERLLAAGEHHLAILSEFYRNQSIRFVVERAAVREITVVLQDPTPLLIFEHPAEARVYLNGELIADTQTPRPVEPGVHEVRFQVSDYTIIRPVTIQRGRTYRIGLSVDVTVTESE